MASIVPGVHFCIKCGAPLSSYAAIGPFESVLAEGHVYRSAVERPRNLIILLGIWVIFGMTALACLVVLLVDSVASVDSAIAAFLLIASVVILWRTTRNYQTRKREHPESHG